MIRVPRIRLSGPIGQRDATPLLTVAAFLITARLPMGFVVLLLLPIAAVVVHGINRRSALPRPLAILLGVCATTSTLGVLTTNPARLAGTGNNLIIIAAITAVAMAVFRGNRRELATRGLFDGIYLGLLFNWTLSMFEAISGFKFLPLMYPDANTAAAVAQNRLFVAALFPNYNDYSVSMTILFLCVLSRVVFQPVARPLAAMGRWTVLASTAFFIIHMGSRGALGGLAIGATVLSVLSVRVVRPRAITARLVVGTLALGITSVTALALSPWVQDNSTATRGIIFRKVRQMIAEDPVRGLIGYGSGAEYLKTARAIYGDILMDPHNMLLEFVTWFGIPGLLCYLTCWWLVTRHGVLLMRRNPGWRTVAACVVTLIHPLLGIVTSSSLRYHQVWLWLIIALSGLTGGGVLPRRGSREERPASPATSSRTPATTRS